MIKEIITELVQELNLLSEDHDTLMKVDWSSRNIILSQTPGVNQLANRLWILINSSKDRGSEIQVISSAKLRAIKQLLYMYLNNSKDHVIVPKKFGFELIAYKEILFKNQFTNLWTPIGEINFKFSKIGTFLLRIKNRDYRELRRSLESVTMS